MSDPREREDANSAWARPGQPSPDGAGTDASDQPHQQPWQPEPQRNWPPQQHWQQSPQQNWQPGAYQDQPYAQQWPQHPAGTGQPFYGGQPYGGPPQPAPLYGEVPPAPSDVAKRSRAPLFIVLGLLVVVLGVAAVYFFGGRSTLDQQAAETGVAQVLTQSYGLENVTDVTCPSGRRVKKNDSFTCTVTFEGEIRDVTITFVDDKGTYEVGRPN
jgi:hypothetical protein